MRSMSQLKSVNDIKGIHFAAVRSIPKVQRSSYLELYVLDREIDRLEKDKFAIDKRRNNTLKRLRALTLRMIKLRKELNEEDQIRNQKHIITRKPVKTMSIKY